VSTDPILHPRRGVAAVITLNRPARRNALNHELLRQLGDRLAAIRADPTVRALVITGSGSAFCAGMDLEEVFAETVDSAGAAAEALLEVLRRISGLPIPTIAAVNGPAVAGGAGIMSACDFVLMSQAARTGYPEVRRGLVAAMVMSFLIRQTGDRAARKLLLTGELIGADEALRIGLATEVVAPDRLMPRVDELLESLCECGPQALALTKSLLDQVGHGRLADDLSLSHETHLTARLSDESREGTAAFREKRKPSWTAG